MILADKWWEMPQASAWLLLSFMTMIGYTTFLCIHTLYFHPLSRYPGPFFARLTDAYSAFRSYQGNMHLDIRECHQKYGKVVRYGPNRLLTLDATDFQNIYGYGKPFRKAQSYATMVPWTGGETTATSIDKTLHRSLRHTFASGLSAPSLKQFECAVTQNLEAYLQKLLDGARLSGGWSQARDMNLWNQWLSFDTMADFGFGTRIGFLEDPNTRYLLEILHIHGVKLGVYEQWPSLSKIGIAHYIAWMLRKTSPKAQRFDSWYRKFAEEITANNCDTRNGILAHLVEGVGTGKSTSGHTKEQMLAEGSFTVFTASEGNATVLSAVQFYLAHDRDILKEVTSEIRERFPHGETICWGPELASCEYLRACIDEGLRMLPPSSGAHWRESEKQGVLSKGEEYPAGCDIGVSLPAMFRSHDVFRDADRFWPQRWLKGVLPEEELARARKTFKPFLIGSRACVGQNTAIMITSVSLANLLNKYDFKLGVKDPCDSEANITNDSKERDDRSELHFENHFTSSWKEGPHIQFRERAYERELSMSGYVS